MTDETTDTPGGDAHLHDAQHVTSGDERAVADRELRELAEHWEDRSKRLDERSAGGIGVEQRSLWGDARRRFAHNKLAVASLAIVVLFAILAIVVPITSHANCCLFVDAKKNLGPSMQHPFGTDIHGRDTWLRAWQGARISLAIGFAVALVILVVGTIYGAISGYVGGRLDNAMMRFLDALYGIPYLPFAIIFVTLMRERWDNLPAIAYMVPALSVTTWFTAARIVRGQVLALKENEYVEAAESQGARWPRTISRHILPNALGIFVVAVFLEVPNAILGEAVLSFLGLGVQPPEASWGKMAQEYYTYFNIQPLLILVPGALIAITVLCAIAIADGLRDALDPRHRVN